MCVMGAQYSLFGKGRKSRNRHRLLLAVSGERGRSGVRVVLRRAGRATFAFHLYHPKHFFLISKYYFHNKRKILKKALFELRK